MKVIPIALLAHYQQPVTTLAYLWRLARQDGFILGLTDHDEEIIFGGETYRPGGFTPTASRSTSDLSVDNLEAEGILDSDLITEEDLQAGKWDGAEVHLLRLNYRAPEDGGELIRRGWIGEVNTNGDQFQAELRGLTQKLQQSYGIQVSPMCRHDLGDARCQVDLAAHTVTGTVESSTDRDHFYEAARADGLDGRWTDGRLTWTSGNNVGIVVSVKSADGGNVILQEVMPHAIATGDSYSLVKGCPKTRGICKTRFSNVPNFGGFPDLPGRDQMSSPTIEST